MHLNNVPVVSELLQRGGVEAEGRESGARQSTPRAGSLQKGELVGRKACKGREQEANVVDVLQSCFLPPHRPSTQGWPGQN